MKKFNIDIARNGYATTVTTMLALALASFALVPLMVFLYRPFFIYYNGSDEQIYLTYQGALALWDDRSRGLSSKLVWLAHEMGMSGAELNFVMDMFSPVTVFVLMVYFVSKGFAEKIPLVVAWWIVFGSILFNQANPLLEGLLPDFRYSDTFWISAFEGWAPFIRSPEPQLSIVFALAAACVFLKTRFWPILLVPVPFLYDNVLMPYGYLVAVAVLSRLFRPRDLLQAVVLNSAIFLVLGIALMVLNRLGVFAHLEFLPTHYRQTRSPALSITLILAIMTVLHLAWNRHRITRPFSAWDHAIIAVAFLQLFLSNHSLISGISIFPQALQSVGGTMGAAFMFYANLRLLTGQDTRREAIALVVGGCLILFSIHNSQGVKLLQNHYRFNIYHDISAEDLERFRSNPLGYIAPYQFFKGYIGLAYPKQLIPPMAHYYNFPYFMASCEPLARINAAAATFIEENRNHPALQDKWAGIEPEVLAIRKSLAEIKEFRDACPPGLPTEVAFEIYETRDDTMLMLRLLPPVVLRQGVDF